MSIILSLFWVGLFIGGIIALAYHRVGLKSSTLAIGFAVLAYTWLGAGGWLWLSLLWLALAGLVLLNIGGLRRRVVTAPLLRLYRTLLPSMSDTEREALEAGTVWWEGELFSGRPDWNRLMSEPAPGLSKAEQDFLDGPTEELCGMLDEWDLTHHRLDMTPAVWDFIIHNGFFAMIIPEEYGGRGFSAQANSLVLQKIASVSATVASTIGVPNSLGPAELLLSYGTKAQKQRYLPGLAAGPEIPCFALTAPRAGSDAASIPDTGVVRKGEWQGEEIIGIRLNWRKRYITLAPVATVLGLAFKLSDPDHLIGERDDYGITAALIPVELPGIDIGRRHFPLNTPFQNGPTSGEDVFVPLDAIIGGQEMAGQGWRMLMELLSAGRCITLPSSATGAAKMAVYTAGAYTRIRKQFNLPVGKFEGVGEVLARMVGLTYIAKAATAVTVDAVDRGEKPAVASAILKCHATEFNRQVINDAMDVHGGKGIMMGPKNYLARSYESVPIGITVEGANILTRSLIIFGQGAVRCHPWVRKELVAAGSEDEQQALADFDQALFGHIGYALSNAARAFVLALTHARYTQVQEQGSTRRYFQHINRYSAAFALAADMAMLTLGGKLKQKERLSARLGDVLSATYLASMVLKHYDNERCPATDLPLVEWSCRHLLYEAQEQLHGFLRNFPNPLVATFLRFLIFPRGRTYFAPSDVLGQQLVERVINPTETRERLCDGIYKTCDGDNPVGLLQEALELAIEVAPLEARLRAAVKEGRVVAPDLPRQVDQAKELGLFSAEEAAQLRDYDAKVMAIINVDDFSAEELGGESYLTPGVARTIYGKSKQQGAGKAPAPKKRASRTEDKEE